jgi:hypothetical protein
MTEESKAAAEDYRQQRQHADAQRSGFAYSSAGFDEWLAQNEQRLRDLIKANGTAHTDVEETIEAYKAYLASASSGSQLDGRNARAILDPILRDIEDLCREQKIPSRNDRNSRNAPLQPQIAM